MAKPRVYLNPALFVPNQDVHARFRITLLDCPFCASSLVGLYAGPLPHVTCLACGADGPLQDVLGDGREAAQYRAAIEWNKRLTK